MRLKNPEIRYLSDLKKVLYDQKLLKKTKDFPVYYIWRKIKEKNGLRYDITVIPPRLLAKEFVKTKGHYHIGKYKELYGVLKGEAIFLLQKEEKGGIEDVYYVKAKRGDWVLIPGGYGHVTINPILKILKMANWISKECRSDYKPIEKKRGACYYYLKSGWIKNKNYQKIPKLRFEKPLKSKPKDLSFLIS